jgi:DnaK suppressor protein
MMNRSEIERHRTRLLGKQTELSIVLGNRDDIAIKQAADKLDEVQFAGERELAIRNLDRDSKLLRSVRSALARIEDGSYGVCLRCDTAIGPKRLSAVPWAAYCVRCQELADRYDCDSGAASSPHDLLAV